MCLTFFKLNPLQDVVYTRRRFVKTFSMLFYPLQMLKEGLICREHGYWV